MYDNIDNDDNHKHTMKWVTGLLYIADTLRHGPDTVAKYILTKWRKFCKRHFQMHISMPHYVLDR